MILGKLSPLRTATGRVFESHYRLQKSPEIRGFRGIFAWGGVWAQRKPCIAAAQHGGNRFHTHPVLKLQRRECVSQIALA